MKINFVGRLDNFLWPIALYSLFVIGMAKCLAFFKILYFGKKKNNVFVVKKKSKFGFLWNIKYLEADPYNKLNPRILKNEVP